MTEPTTIEGVDIETMDEATLRRWLRTFVERLDELRRNAKADLARKQEQLTEAVAECARLQKIAGRQRRREDRAFPRPE